MKHIFYKVGFMKNEHTVVSLNVNTARGIQSCFEKTYQVNDQPCRVDEGFVYATFKDAYYCWALSPFRKNCNIYECHVDSFMIPQSVICLHSLNSSTLTPEDIRRAIRYSKQKAEQHFSASFIDPPEGTIFAQNILLTRKLVPEQYFKVVRNEGNVLTSASRSIPRRFQKVYRDSDFNYPIVDEGMIFDTFIHAENFIEEQNMSRCSIWTCCVEKAETVNKVLLSWSMEALNADSSWGALIKMQPFIDKSFLVPAPYGTLIARNIRLLEKAD